MRHDPTFWLLARAFGLTAYVMLTFSVLLGLTIRSRPLRSLKPAVVTDLHRILALFGLLALGGHAVALVLDSTVRVTVPALFVPGLIAYRPCLDVRRGAHRRDDGDRVPLLLATKAHRHAELAASPLGDVRHLRRRNDHGLAAGSDSSRPWAFGIYVAAVGSVAAATAWRAVVPPAAPAYSSPRGASAEQSA